MAGAVNEILGKARPADHPTGGVVHFCATHGGARRPALAQQRHSGVARTPHRLPHPAHLRIGGAPSERHPRLIGEHGRPHWRRPRPQIEQQDLAGLKPEVGADVGLVVRQRGVGAERRDRGLTGDQPRALDRIQHTPLQRRLADLGAPRGLASRPGEGLRRDRGKRLRRAPVPLELRRAPARSEAGDERSRRDHLRAERFEQLHDAVRHAVEVWHRVPGGDLHRDGATAHQRLDLRVELAP